MNGVIELITVGDKKAVLCKGNFHPAQLYKGETKIAGYTETEFEGEGTVTLEDCYNDKIYDVLIYGKNLFDVQKYYGDYANENGGISIPNSGVLYQISSYFTVIQGVFKENTRYTFSCDYDVTEATTVLQPQFIYTDGKKSSVQLNSANSGTSGTLVLKSAAGKTVKSFSFTYGTTSKTFTGELTNIQIEEGTVATEYEAPVREATVTVKSAESTDKEKTVLFENGDFTEEIPTFKGDVVIEVESDIAATIRGRYKKQNS